MKTLELISWIAHRLAMAFACITIGFVLAFLVVYEDMERMHGENLLLRQMIQQCATPEQGYRL